MKQMKRFETQREKKKGRREKKKILLLKFKGYLIVQCFGDEDVTCSRVIQLLGSGDVCNHTYCPVLDCRGHGEPRNMGLSSACLD